MEDFAGLGRAPTQQQPNLAKASWFKLGSIQRWKLRRSDLRHANMLRLGEGHDIPPSDVDAKVGLYRYITPSQATV